MEKQTLYIAIDDSGIFDNSEKIACYGGIIFLNILERDKFITQYKKIVKKYKCHYCFHKGICQFGCPELKNHNLNSTHKRHFLNYIKKYHLMACIIDNSKIYQRILNNKLAKGRYIDYAIKMLIKESIKSLIKERKINPNLDLEIILNIDESTHKSNGYYDLKTSIYEELKHGINNIKNNIHFQNIINGDLKITLYFRNSKKCYPIQAADLIAGTIRKSALNNQLNKKTITEELNYINYKIYLPK